MAERRGSVGALLSPRVVLGVFAALLVAVVLATPDVDGRNGDPRLTSRSAEPNGARGLAEALARLGWRVERREAAYVGPRAAPLETGAVHAVLAPPRELRGSEVHVLLDAVRRGGALLAVVQRGTALADSLGYLPSRTGMVIDPDSADVDGCAADARDGALTWFGGRMNTTWLTDATNRGVGDRPVPRPAGAVDFEHARPALVTDSGPSTVRFPAARGLTLGRGRVVVVADPDLLRNDVIRVCRWGAGVAAVRMSEWLAGAPQSARRMVFDEYHQGDVGEAHPMRVVGRTLVATRGGRAVAQLALASLVLLAAVGGRALPPVSRPRAARRSPLEHVEALAAAYTQVGATRLVARRLARGLRRRHGRVAWRAAGASGDAQFLAAVAVRHPAVADDVARLLAAAERPTTDARRVAAAAAAIDRALTPRP